MSVAKKIFATVPDSLAKRLEDRADNEGRSVSSLAAYLLERAMDEWEEKMLSVDSNGNGQTVAKQ